MMRRRRDMDGNKRLRTALGSGAPGRLRLVLAPVIPSLLALPGC